MTSPSSSWSCSGTSTTACPPIIRSRVWQRRCPGARTNPSRGCSAPRRRARIWAAELGLPYAFADFINPKGAEIAALYRERFAAHEHAGVSPRTAVGVWVICAEDDEQARALAASGRMAFTMLRRGQLIAVPPVEQAQRFLAAEARERERGDAAGDAPRSERRTVVGGPDTVREQLAEVVSSYGAEEAIVVCITYEHDARRRSYELLAEAFQLPGRI